MITARGVVFGRNVWFCSVRKCLSTGLQSMSSTPETSEEVDGKQSPEISKLWLAARGLMNPRTGEKRKLTNWSYGCEVSAFAQRIGFSSEDLPSLGHALTPPQTPLPTIFSKRSEEDTGATEDAELTVADSSRLSAVGRSAINHYVTEYVFCTYKHVGGSSLRAICSAVASPEVLCGVADHLGIVDLLRTPQNVMEPLQTKLVSQSLSAVIGAVYVDQGTLAARGLVHDFLIAHLTSKDIDNVIRFERPKATLAELLKRQGKGPPQSRLIRESGRASHYPTFVVGIFSDDEQLSEAAGSSLKRAENEALLAALRSHFQEEMKRGPLPSDLEAYQDEREMKLFWSEQGKDKEASTSKDEGTESSLAQ